jgi:hypothetical protein
MLVIIGNILFTTVNKQIVLTRCPINKLSMYAEYQGNIKKTLKDT